MSHASDEDLLRRVLSGERAASNELALRLGPVLLTCARRFRKRTGASTAEQELVQDAWVELCRDEMKALRAWRVDKGASLGTYVQRVAWRKWTHLQRKVQSDRRGGGMQPVEVDPDELHARQPTSEEEVGGREVVAQLEQWLWPQIALKGQLIARYIHHDGLSPAETARAMGVTVTVVNNWTFKIRTLVRTYLDLGPPGASRSE